MRSVLGSRRESIRYFRTYPLFGEFPGFLILHDGKIMISVVRLLAY